MKIPKIFGNRAILLVVALALFIIVIFSFLKIINLEETGFASLNQENTNQQNVQINENPLSSEETTSSNTQSEENNLVPNTNDYEYILLDENSPNISSDISSITKKSSSRRSGGGSSSGGTGGGSSNSNSNNSNQNQNNGNGNTEEQNNGNNNENPPISLKRKITKKPKDLVLKRNNLEVSDEEEFQGKVRLNLEKSNKKIAAFDVNFEEDVDLSDIIADSDFELGKAYMHSTSGKLQNIDLYVPIEDGDIAVVVCSNADSYDEIYYGCADNPEITKEELLYLSGPRVDRSEDGLYFIVHGITGTGATGVNVTEINSSSQNPTPPSSLESLAGNITEITTPDGLGKTQAWQGYYGNVSGTIQLADSADNVMYNWTLASPEGQVFASTNNSIVWVNVQCFNFTSTGTYQDETGNGGSTNLYGTNLTQLENQYNIDSYDVDGVDETFYLLGAGTHNVFYVNAKEFSEGECQNTRINDDSGFGQDNHFEEAIMYEPTTQSIIFAALLNEDVLGFDNRTHDFEMLVLEDGHNTDTATTTYYFYAVMF